LTKYLSAKAVLVGKREVTFLSFGGDALNTQYNSISFPPQALSTDSVERLPVYNKTALRNYKVSQEADDWCVPSREPLDLTVYRVAK
jgi:hypothetical protein